MLEGGEKSSSQGEAQSFAPTPQQNPERRRPSIRQVARRVIDEIKGGRKIPPEEIQDSTVAYVIWKSLKNPLSGTNPGEIPFTVIDVMANAGYVGPLRTTDYMKRFPDAYPKFRLSLTNLVRAGVVEMGQMPKPDTHHETLYYHIPRDETGQDRQARLSEIASQAQGINPWYKMAT